MKTKFVLLGICVALAGGAVWFGRAAWRAHRKLVTLDVYNAPLGDVLRKIEKQAWTKISADQNLKGPITLRVDNQPLTNVLDRIADQAGARWSTVFAAYAAKNKLAPLEAALRKGDKVDSAGWAKLAPKSENTVTAPDASPADLVMRGPQNGGMPGGMKRLMVRRGPSGEMIVSDGNSVEEWSASELVVEASEKSKLAGREFQAANAQEATEVAQAIKGEWTTYYVLRKTKFGGLPPPVISARRGPRGGTEGPPELKPPRIDPLEKFAKLTPHQRVERARERRAGPVRIEQEVTK
jgi:hypothetical protein